jgi:hypothetical protein
LDPCAALPAPCDPSPTCVTFLPELRWAGAHLARLNAGLAMAYNPHQIADFVTECVHLGVSKRPIRLAAIGDAYERWCEAREALPYPRRRLYLYLRQAGARLGKSNGYTVAWGVILKGDERSISEDER